MQNTCVGMLLVGVKESKIPVRKCQVQERPRCDITHYLVSHSFDADAPDAVCLQIMPGKTSSTTFIPRAKFIQVKAQKIGFGALLWTIT